jgi:hypothetical protein
MKRTYFVRYGSVPEVARFDSRLAEPFLHGDRVVVRTQHGLQLGTILEADLRSAPNEDDRHPIHAEPAPDDAAIPSDDFEIVRRASDDDEAAARRLQARCEADFYDWCRRVLLWNLSLEVIDLERTLDTERLILYVLSERGPATTTLALQAAAEGLGVVDVQPVSAQGAVTTVSGCGTGSCGCHS